ncbi:MAG: hypothetical protein B5M51_09465 [Anaerolinea sp. 4484_236]|nr:MAG: hypothetical protein B5M51_09465 [Anaerolinea sp. 4484_236]
MSLHFQHKPSFAPAVRAISLILVLFLTLSIAITVVSAAITLNYFTATLEGEEVYLEWETASEMDLAGFYVVRSLSPDAEYTRISSFIYGEGDITGALYNPTISPTPSVSPTASTTPTATPPEAEISLPEQLSFPTKTPTAKPLPGAQPTQSHTETSSPLAKLTSTFSIIGGIIIFWVLLGVAYFKFIRPNN